MVYVIGVDHKIQFKYEKTDISLEPFAVYLTEQAKQLKVTLIAEELNEEEISKRRAKGSVVKNVAKKLDKEHRFCDPDSSERDAIGIPSITEIKEKLGLRRFHSPEEEQILCQEEKRYFPRRERFWFDRIKDKLHEPIIFVCGYKHVKSFKSLLTKEGCDVKVLNQTKERI